MARISPKIGNLKFAKGTVPTVKGPISIEWKKDGSFKLKLVLPKGIEAMVDLPKVGKRVLVDGKPVKAEVQGDRLVLEEWIQGSVVLEVK